MLHALDIRASIAAHRTSDLQIAMGLLALGRLDHTWPSDSVVDAQGKEIDQLTREELLIDVCDELEDCHDSMPADLCSDLGLQSGATYSEGAAVIMAED